MSSADLSTGQPVDKQAYAILRTRTSEAEAIHASELSEQLRLGDGQTSPAARELIEEVTEQYNCPIVSSHNGYWVATTTEDLQDYLYDLRQRKAGLNQRMELVTAAFNRRRYADD